MDTAGNEGAVWARQIQDAGWKQCSVFRPPGDAAAVLPAYLNLRPDEWLLVCTQSCSVCSRNFESEPLVEVLAATPIARFNRSHGEAQGKVSHAFHLPISGLHGAEALRCQLGRRAFISRRHLLDWRPENAWSDLDALNSFKGWLANYYMRIALPDQLMDRLHAPGGIRELVKTVLEIDVGSGQKAEDGVNSFYIEAGPDEELPPTRLYEISLLVVCNDEATKELLDRKLGMLKGRPSSPISVEGVVVAEVTVKVADDTTLADLKGKSRFNDWDHMSPLTERLRIMQETL